MNSTNSDAEAVGRIAGQAVFFLLVTAGLVKCILISRRETTNTKCVWSLALFLFIFIIAGGMGLFRLNSPMATMLLGLVAIAVMLASIALAIVGLAEYSAKPGRYVQGRAQAIWALALTGIFGGIAVVGGVTKATTRLGALAKQPPPGHALIFEDSNFSFIPPGRPWVQADAARLNSNAKVAFLRARPEMYLIIIAEPLGNLDVTLDSAMETARARMQSLSETARVVRKVPTRIGHLDGVEVDSQMMLAGNPLSYAQWFCVTNGWAFQLTAWGRTDVGETVVQEARRAMEGFAMLDPHRRSAVAGGMGLEDYTSTNLGFRVRCADSAWTKWANLDADCAYASFGALHRENVVMAVNATPLGGLKPGPEAVYRGLFGLLTTTDPLNEAHRIHEHGLDGVEAEFVRNGTTGKELAYRAKVLQGGNMAYLIVAWTERNNPRREELLADAMSRIDFTGTQPTASDPSDLSPRELRAQRMGLNSIGVAYYKQQRFDLSIPYFKKAADLSAGETNTIYLKNFVDACIRTENYRAALDELNLFPDHVAGQPALRASEAYLQGRLGQTELALTNYGRVFAGGFSSEDYFNDYVTLLALSGQSTQALAEAETYVKRQDSPAIRLAQAALLKRVKRFDDAISLLQDQRAKNPFYAGFAYSLGDAYIQARKPSEALKLSEDLLKDGGSAGAWMLKGRAQFALKWYRQARESFQNVIKEAPADKDAREYLDAIAGVVGEGSTAGIQESIDPVPVPGILTNVLPTVPEGFGDTEGAYYTRYATAISFNKEQPFKETDYLRIHVLSAMGVSSLSSFQVEFNPLNDEICVNELQVKDAGGNLVSTGRLADYYVLDNPTKSSASSRKLLNIPIPGLQSGCDIALTVTRRELGPSDDFPFLACNFAGTLPIQERDLLFTGDTNLIRHASSPEITEVALPQGLLWRKATPPVVRWEPLTPGIMDYVPNVWIADAAARWPELATGYASSIRDRAALPDDEKQLAQRLTASATNVAQKVAAIGTYVQTNFTYKAIEFGRRARLPQPLVEVMRNRFGDCKDHAVLAQQMLAAAGVPARLALVNPSVPVREDLPSLDQFNHMIVCVPSPGGDIFLDCTAKGYDLTGRSGGIGLAGRDALILDGADTHFERIPPYPAGASVIKVMRSVEVTNQTEALVHETLRLSGVHAGFYRQYFEGQPVATRRIAAEGLFVGRLGELRTFAISGLGDPTAPLVIDVTYVARDEFHAVDNDLTGGIPLQFERSLLLDESVEKRTTPFEVSIPLVIEGTVEVKVPAHFKPRPIAVGPGVQNQFVTCQLKPEVTGTGWRLNYRVTNTAGRYPAEQYATYNNAMQQAVEALSPRLVCARGGG